MTRTSELLKQDLAALGITQKEFAERLSERIEKHISQQAISLWCARDYIPPRRRADVIAALGDGSMLAVYLEKPESKLDRVFSRAKEFGRIVSSETMDIDALIYEAIPDALVNERIQVGPYNRRFNFIGKQVVANYVTEIGYSERTHFNPFKIARSMLNLAVAKRELNDARRFVLIMIGNGEGNQLEQVLWECAHLGVECVRFDDAEGAAQYIIGIEDAEPTTDEVDDTYQ